MSVSEQFQNPIEKSQKDVKSIPLAHPVTWLWRRASFCRTSLRWRHTSGHVTVTSLHLPVREMLWGGAIVPELWFSHYSVTCLFVVVFLQFYIYIPQGCYTWGTIAFSLLVFERKPFKSFLALQFDPPTPIKNFKFPLSSNKSSFAKESFSLLLRRFAGKVKLNKNTYAKYIINNNCVPVYIL